MVPADRRRTAELADVRVALVRGVAERLEFTTDGGALDCDDYGRERFDQVASRAVSVELIGLPVLVAAIEDLIDLKRQAGRAMDMHDVHLLTLVQDEARQDPAIHRLSER